MEILLAVASFPACFFVHLLLQRSGLLERAFSSRQAGVAWVCALNGLALGVISQSAYVLFCAVGFSHLYFHVYNYTETARRIRILTTLFQARDLENYSGGEILTHRLERLTLMGSLRREDERFFSNGGVMVTAAKVFRQLRRLFYPRTSES